ncbi:hypothetical protein R9X47_10530 [Wukongibacter baidiensis]|uniref:hypothetical protein n=1 Tax=Wukongibacter baidiensis TaxID=1723361 RepID=UPI003D7FE456
MEHNIFIDNIIKSKSAIITGNGFSINFDSDFSRIYEKLGYANKFIVRNLDYEINTPNKVLKRRLKDNFNSVKSYIRYFSQSKMDNLFQDGLDLANKINDDKVLIKKLIDNKSISVLTFGISQATILERICTVGNKYGYSSVNIENWSVLLFFYYAINELEDYDFNYPEANEFIALIKSGDINRELVAEPSILQNIVLNGFFTYYRALFSVAIFNNGKVIEPSKLENIESLDIDKIRDFFDNFDVVWTLNYDYILESIIDKSVPHLHGEYIINRKSYSYFQSLSFEYEDKLIEMSNIDIGDYITFKSFYPILKKLSSGKSFNAECEYTYEMVEQEIKNSTIDTIVIFGVNVENDYHIFRHLITGLYFANVESPQIIYCYYGDHEEDEFKKTFESVLTFSNELNEYAKNIKLQSVSTKEIIEHTFRQ